MAGGLLQLKEKGAQDIYLTGNPQITFFKIVYRRHTNFSIESIEQIWINRPSNDQLSTRCIIGRKGDLISKIYIQDVIYADNIFSRSFKENNPGYDQINKVNIQIGSQIIDEHTNNWLETYSELTQKNEYGCFSSTLNAITMCDTNNSVINKNNIINIFNEDSDLNGLFTNSLSGYNLNGLYTSGLSEENNHSNLCTKFQSLTLSGGVGGCINTIDNINNSNRGEYLSGSYNESGSFFWNTLPNSPPKLLSGSLIPPSASSTWTVNNSRPFFPQNSDNNDTRTIMGYSNYFNNNSFGYIHVPLQFWFCRNPGLALPLIALQYNEVIININFKYIIKNPQLYVDYIFLDTDERRRFAQISHEYLIEQVQTIRSTPGLTHNLKFKNPVKELIWVSSTSDNISSADYGDSLKGEWKLQINGNDRFTYRDISYFTKQQIYDYHSGYGGVTVRNSIAVYSFCLYPEDHQPSGTMNFSNIQYCYLLNKGRSDLEAEIINNQNIIVYAVNYNILRILSGQGSLAYTN